MNLQILNPMETKDMLKSRKKLRQEISNQYAKRILIERGKKRLFLTERERGT